MSIQQHLKIKIHKKKQFQFLKTLLLLPPSISCYPNSIVPNKIKRKFMLIISKENVYECGYKGVLCEKRRPYYSVPQKEWHRWFLSMSTHPHSTLILILYIIIIIFCRHIHCFYIVSLLVKFIYGHYLVE